MQESNQEESQSSKLKQDYWRKICEEWQESGESQPAYCLRLGIKLNTFTYWRAKFSGKNKKSKKTFVKLTPAILSSGEQEKPIIIHLPCGIKIFIPISISKDKLTNLFEVFGEINA